MHNHYKNLGECILPNCLSFSSHWLHLGKPELFSMFGCLLVTWNINGELGKNKNRHIQKIMPCTCVKLPFGKIQSYHVGLFPLCRSLYLMFIFFWNLSFLKINVN